MKSLISFSVVVLSSVLAHAQAGPVGVTQQFQSGASISWESSCNCYRVKNSRGTARMNAGQMTSYLSQDPVLEHDMALNYEEKKAVRGFIINVNMLDDINPQEPAFRGGIQPEGGGSDIWTNGRGLTIYGYGSVRSLLSTRAYSVNELANQSTFVKEVEDFRLNFGVKLKLPLGAKR